MKDFEKPIKQPTAIVSFFVKEGEGDSTFIQRQIGFFFKYNMGVFLSVISLFFWHNKYLHFNSVSL